MAPGPREAEVLRLRQAKLDEVEADKEDGDFEDDDEYLAEGRKVRKLFKARLREAREADAAQRQEEGPAAAAGGMDEEQEHDGYATDEEAAAQPAAQSPSPKKSLAAKSSKEGTDSGHVVGKRSAGGRSPGNQRAAKAARKLKASAAEPEPDESGPKQTQSVARSAAPPKLGIAKPLAAAKARAAPPPPPQESQFTGVTFMKMAGDGITQVWQAYIYDHSEGRQRYLRSGSEAQCIAAVAKVREPRGLSAMAPAPVRKGKAKQLAEKAAAHMQAPNHVPMAELKPVPEEAAEFRSACGRLRISMHGHLGKDERGEMKKSIDDPNKHDVYLGGSAGPRVEVRRTAKRARSSGAAAAAAAALDIDSTNPAPRLSEHARGQGAFNISKLKADEVLELVAEVMPSSTVGAHEEDAIQYAQSRGKLKGQIEWSGLARDASGIVYKIHAKSLEDLRRAEEILYPKGAKNRRKKGF